MTPEQISCLFLPEGLKIVMGNHIDHDGNLTLFTVDKIKQDGQPNPLFTQLIQSLKSNNLSGKLFTIKKQDNAIFNSLDNKIDIKIKEPDSSEHSLIIDYIEL